jgi:hypothetical protein
MLVQEAAGVLLEASSSKPFQGRLAGLMRVVISSKTVRISEVHGRADNQTRHAQIYRVFIFDL